MSLTKRQKNKIKKIIYGIISAIIVAGISLHDDYQLANKVLDNSAVVFSAAVDGDTAKFVIDGETQTVRFLAIDTPETVHPTIGEEPFGKEASDLTKELLGNAANITLEYEDDLTDNYGRVLAWIFVDDILLQEVLVEQGLAEVKYEKSTYKYVKDLYTSQEKAQNEKLGIWSLD